MPLPCSLALGSPKSAEKPTPPKNPLGLCVLRLVGLELVGDLLDDAELDALALRQAHPRLILADHEHVFQAGREDVAHRVLNLDDVERARVLLDVLDHTHAPSVATALDSGELADAELDEVNGLARGQVHLNRVIHLDERVRVTDRAPVVGHKEWNVLPGDLELLHPAKFEVNLIRLDTVEGEAALGVVQKAELVVRPLHRHNIHEARRVGRIGAHFPIHLHKLLHADGGNLLRVERILKAVAEDEHKGEALPELVGPGRGARGPNTIHLPKHPRMGGIKPLQVLLRTARHIERLGDDGG
mmetsp:Transcript_31120/g.69883  ORF Transcript_31120/g.69883 Transcript_31120/m.69883 type:complete len:300 (+) Transcript_31120:123-1022(+)